MKTVQDVKMDLLTYAQHYDLDSAVLVQAMAETLATCARTLDLHGEPCAIEDRLTTFSDHVQAEYRKLQRASVTGLADLQLVLL